MLRSSSSVVSMSAQDRLKMGSPQEIVDWLCENPLRLAETRSFVLCMHKFVEVGQVWEMIKTKIVGNLGVYTPDDWGKHGELVFLGRWIEYAFERDFGRGSNSLFKPLLAFCKTLPSFLGNRVKLLVLKSSIAPKALSGTPKPSRRRSDEREKRKSTENATQQARSSSFVGGKTMRLSGSHTFLNVSQISLGESDPRQLAEQITCSQQQHFCSIKDSDLMGLAWRKDPECGLSLLTSSFNHLSSWIASEIVTTYNMQNRVKTISNCIQTAEHLLELNNFHGLMSFIAGLGYVSVSRLRKTWDLLPEKSTDTLETLSNIMETSFNYRNYRTLLKGVTGPVIPYVGIYTRDFTFIEDGNPDKDEEGRINLDKICMMGDIFHEIRTFQSRPYSIARVESIQTYLKSAPTATEETLYRSSLLCEPSPTTLEK